MSTSEPWFLMNRRAEPLELALRVTTRMSPLGGPSPGNPFVESNLTRDLQGLWAPALLGRFFMAGAVDRSLGPAVDRAQPV